jgi:GTP cyclohydrolase IA
MDHEKVAGLVRELLREIGEDPKREGLVNTPRRIAEALEFLTSGYRANPREIIEKAIFVQETHNMVIARDIELYSLCEHHMLPFFGRCHIGYIAKDHVVGVSKLARLVDVYTRRLQIQERLTEQIAHSLLDVLQADGVGVTIEAQHLCMMMRGVQKQNSMMTTSTMLGSFRSSVATRTEFLTLIGRHRP